MSRQLKRDAENFLEGHVYICSIVEPAIGIISICVPSCFIILKTGVERGPRALLHRTESDTPQLQLSNPPPFPLPQRVKRLLLKRSELATGHKTADTRRLLPARRDMSLVESSQDNSIGV